MTTDTVTTLLFDEITEPGTYVCNWNGHLLQIPPVAVQSGTLNWSIVGGEPLNVTRISADATIPVDVARKLAKEFDVNVNF